MQVPQANLQPSHWSLTHRYVCKTDYIDLCSDCVIVYKVDSVYNVFIAIGLKARLGDPLDQSLSASAACFAAVPDGEVVMVCGFWDNSFKCFATKSGKYVDWLSN